MRVKRYLPGVWYQTGGDMTPERHGGVICRDDNGTIDARWIQPVIEFVGEREGAEVGYPLWSREGCYDDDALRTFLRERRDIDESDMPEEWLAIRDGAPMTRKDRLHIAGEAVNAGYLADEGPCGWSTDVVPRRVTWWGCRGDLKSWRAEDADFRRMLREANRS